MRAIAFTGEVELTRPQVSTVRCGVQHLAPADLYISGAAFGVDTVAGLTAIELHPHAEHRVYVPAAWHNAEGVEQLHQRGAVVIEVDQAGSVGASYMARNDRMVAECTELVGFPYTAQEEVRSGTWATIRRARKAHRGLTIQPLCESGPLVSGFGSFQSEGPWDAPDTHYFYGRGTPFSMFVPTPGLVFPMGWLGHPTPPRMVELPTGEHGFHVCKAVCEEDALWILSAPSAASAKRRGGPHGEDGRHIQLRPDWEDVKFDVMLWLNRRKYLLPRFREALLATGDRPLVENSPSDPFWGGRDRRGGFTGENLLGLVLMQVRAELRAASR